MAPSLADVAGLKDLVNQLQDKINNIERSIKGGAGDTSADRIRMILMGPPGAGEFLLLFISLLNKPPWLCALGLVFLQPHAKEKPCCRG